MKTTIDPKTVAIDFIARVGEYIGTDNLAEIDRLNAEEPNPDICHSHDFCDANYFMLKAVNAALGLDEDDYGIHNREQNDLFTAAQIEARAMGFHDIYLAEQGRRHDEKNGNIVSP